MNLFKKNKKVAIGKTITWEGEDVRPAKITGRKRKKALTYSLVLMSGYTGLINKDKISHNFNEKETTELIGPKNITLEDKINNIKEKTFYTVTTKSNSFEKYQAYEHNVNIVVNIAKLYAEKYAKLPGKFKNPNNLLKETVTQMYQESHLQQTTIEGNIVGSYQGAKGAGQFLDIGIKGVNKQISLFNSKNEEEENLIKPIDLDIVFTPTVKGAVENIRANIFNKKLNLEKYHNSKYVSALYHQGSGNMQNAKKRAGSDDKNEILKFIGPKGKDYVNRIEKHKENYKEIEQFKEYAITVFARNLMGRNISKANRIRNKNKKIELFEEVYSFNKELELIGKSTHQRYLKKSMYNLAKLYKESNPEKSYELATTLKEMTEDKKNKTDKFYFDNANYIIRTTSIN